MDMRPSARVGPLVGAGPGVAEAVRNQRTLAHLREQLLFTPAAIVINQQLFHISKGIWICGLVEGNHWILYVDD
jgi:hypothetical protein